MENTDIRATSATSSDIYRIKANYFRDEAERRKKTVVDLNMIAEIETLEAGPTTTTPTVTCTVGTLDTTSASTGPTPSTVPPSTSQAPMT